MKKSLLIISCSGRKIETPGRLPAFERYDGFFYQIIRKVMREGNFPNNLDILMISPKYGLLTLRQEIKNYDQDMSDAQARILRPIIHKELESYLDGKDYQKLFINMGSKYTQTLHCFDWRKHFSEKIEAKGRIGEKGSQLKAWLIELSQDS